MTWPWLLISASLMSSHSGIFWRGGGKLSYEVFIACMYELKLATSVLPYLDIHVSYRISSNTVLLNVCSHFTLFVVCLW